MAPTLALLTRVRVTTGTPNARLFRELVDLFTRMEGDEFVALRIVVHKLVLSRRQDIQTFSHRTDGHLWQWVASADAVDDTVLLEGDVARRLTHLIAKKDGDNLLADPDVADVIRLNLDGVRLLADIMPLDSTAIRVLESET